MKPYTISTVNNWYRYNDLKIYRPKPQFQKNLIELRNKPVYIGSHFNPTLIIGKISDAFFVGDELKAYLDIEPIYQHLVKGGFSIGFTAKYEMDSVYGISFSDVHYDHLLITNSPRCGNACKI